MSGSGHNFFLVPCPPTQSTSVNSTPQTSWTGPYIGGELAKNWGRVRSTETFAATGVRTNEFTNTGDPLGFGLVAGYDFAPWGNAVRVGPFASFDILHETVRQNFAGGQFLGTRTNWFATLGARVGYLATNNFQVYALTGVTFVNHDLKVNFATAASSNATTPGFTLGAGFEYRPDFAIGGNPVTLFAHYQHTWYARASFNTPASSPAFNYAFRRRDDMVKVGFKVWFAPPAAAPVSAKY